MERRFFHFSYPGPKKQVRPRLHALRDGDAFVELAAALYEQQKAMKYGGLILNFPVQSDATSIPLLEDSDLLILTTRPPLNDDEFDRRHIKQSGTKLERAIFEVSRRYFSVCRRSHVKLSEEMAAKLKYLNRGEIEFGMYGGAYYKRHRMPYTNNRKQHMWEKPTDTMRTSVFLLNAQMENGPGILNAFGMDGASTLIWCFLLRTVFPNLLQSPRFVMAELSASPLPQEPATLAFASRWKVEILLDYPLGDTNSVY